MSNLRAKASALVERFVEEAIASGLRWDEAVVVFGLAAKASAVSARWRATAMLLTAWRMPAPVSKKHLCRRSMSLWLILKWLRSMLRAPTRRCSRPLDDVTLPNIIDP